MKKVMLVCHGGQSTSILAKQVREASKGEVSIEAFSVNTYLENLEDIKVILVAPQIRFLVKDIQQTVGEDLVVKSIEPRTYGLMDGEAVLKMINAIYEENGLAE